MLNKYVFLFWFSCISSVGTVLGRACYGVAVWRRVRALCVIGLLAAGLVSCQFDEEAEVEYDLLSFLPVIVAVGGTALFSENRTEFREPVAVAVDASDRIYVTDGRSGSTGLVYRLNDIFGLGHIEYDGSLGAEFGEPRGIAFDASGRIYVVDSLGDSVVRFDEMNGLNQTSLSLSTNLRGITVNSGGQIHVARWSAQDLFRADDISGSGQVTYDSAGGLNNVWDVTLDSSDRIYVLDQSTSSGRLFRFDDMTGSNQVSYSGGSVSFAEPNAVWVDSSGKIYVADGDNS